MSINTEMKKYLLQSRTVIHEKSGAEHEEWSGNRVIQVNIKLTDSVPNKGNVKYSDNSHIGLTRCKYIKAHSNRLVDMTTGTVYLIAKVYNSGRVNNLILKEVVQDGG